MTQNKINNVVAMTTKPIQSHDDEPALLYEQSFIRAIKYLY